MENSNTLPVIEIGDTVIFRTDLVDGKMYGRLPYMKSMDEDVKNQSLVFELEGSCFRTEECGYWFTPEMVAQVIKPTKTERLIDNCRHFDIETGCDLDECRCEKETEIKPTKERVYTEEEMKKCWDAATHDALSIGDENYMLLTFKDFIESLNK